MNTYLTDYEREDKRFGELLEKLRTANYQLACAIEPHSASPRVNSKTLDRMRSVNRDLESALLTFRVAADETRGGIDE